MKKIDKQEMKKKIAARMNGIIDDLEKLGNLNFFEVKIKSVNGELVTKLEHTYKDKI